MITLDGRTKVLENVPFAGGPEGKVVSLTEIEAITGKIALKEETIDLDIADPDHCKIVDILQGVRIGDNDAGRAYAKGSSRFCGAIDRSR